MSIKNEKGFARFLELVASVEAEFAAPVNNSIKPEPTQEGVERLELLDREKRSRLLEILCSQDANIKIGNRADISCIQKLSCDGLRNQPWAEIQRGIYKSMWDGNCGDVTGDIWIGRFKFKDVEENEYEPTKQSQNNAMGSHSKSSTTKPKGTSGKTIEHQRAYDFLKDKIETLSWPVSDGKIHDKNGNHMGRHKLYDRLYLELSDDKGKLREGYTMPRDKKPPSEWVKKIMELD